VNVAEKGAQCGLRRQPRHAEASTRLAGYVRHKGDINNLELLSRCFLWLKDRISAGTEMVRDDCDGQSATLPDMPVPACAGETDRKRDNSALISHNVNVHGRRTSVRMEPEIWKLLGEIGRRECCHTDDICTYAADRKPPRGSVSSSRITSMTPPPKTVTAKPGTDFASFSRRFANARNRGGSGFNHRYGPGRPKAARVRNCSRPMAEKCGTSAAARRLRRSRSRN
jgi:Ribbon-helix-helix domain